METDQNIQMVTPTTGISRVTPQNSMETDQNSEMVTPLTGHHIPSGIKTFLIFTLLLSCQITICRIIKSN